MPSRKSAVVKKVLTDPGVDFNIANVILFASISTFGLAANLVAFGISAVSKTLDETKPAFLQKYPRLSKIFHDPKTTLFTSGAALTIVGITSLISGIWIPAAAGFLAAIGKFTTAESLAEAERRKNNTASFSETKKKGWLSTLLKRPDIYISTSFAFAGLMSGGATLLVLPIIAVSGWIAYQNSRQHKPEYAGHPKAIAAVAAASHAVVGIINGNWFPGISATIAAATLLNIECTLTPGGSRQVLHDIKDKFTQMLDGSKKAKKIPVKSFAALIKQSQEKVFLIDENLVTNFNITVANENIPPVSTKAPYIVSCEKK